MNNLKTNDIFIKPGSSDKEKKISSRTITPLTLEEEEMVITYINDKLYTFLRNNPKAKIDCDNRFSNYIAFVYENGMILADRLKGINRISEAQNDAIYVFDVANFESKIKLNKGQLVGNTKRIFHIDGWKDVVDDIANMDTPLELQEKVKKYIKK